MQLALVIPGYTHVVKTAISIPDVTYVRATQLASARGISRSQLVTQAVEAYLDQSEADSLPAAIDQALTVIGNDDSARDAVSAGRSRLSHDGGNW